MSTGTKFIIETQQNKKQRDYCCKTKYKPTKKIINQIKQM